MKITMLELSLKLKDLDKRLGYLSDLPALQKAPQYVRCELTEVRDEMMKLLVQVRETLS